ncbi:MAG: OmpA-OmpF porin, family [Candidatus Binatota bacterium]|nr:OmpA-OmpF porin, family [Candidatus Binatota bacterium]
MARKVLVGVMMLFLVSPAGAYTPPTETGESGLLTLPTTATLPPGKVSVGVYHRRDIENDVIFEPELGHLRDTDAKQTSFVAGIGIINGLELSLDVPLIHYDIDRPGDEFGENPEPRDIGNIHVSPKFRLFREGDNGMPLGLAFLGSVNIPTGSDNFAAPMDRNTMHAENVGGEVMGILDKELFTLPGDAPAVFTLNVGGLFPGEPDNLKLGQQTERVYSQLRRKGFPEVKVANAVVEGGAGLQVPLWKDYVGQLDWMTEFRANSGTLDEVDEYRQVLVGARYGVHNGLALAGGVDFGLSNSVNRYEVLVGASYTGPQPPRALGGPGKTKVVYRDRVIEVERVLFTDVNFLFDKASLTNLGRGQVYLIAQKLKEGKNVKIEIHGHTDYIGTDEYNKTLGLKRAESIKAELGKLNVDPAQISTVSFGEEKPLIDMKTPWARAVNRRVEFVVVGEPKERTQRSGESSR